MPTTFDPVARAHKCAVRLPRSAQARSEGGVSRPIRVCRVPAVLLLARSVLLVWLGFVALSAGSAAEDLLTRGDSPDVDASARAFWRQAQDELLADITLSADQQAGVDAIVAEAARDRSRARDLKKRVDAPGETDSDTKERARAELQELKGKLDPEWRIDAMRELLNEDQRAVFDRNRRVRSDRIFAEQKRRHSRAARARRRAGSGDPSE